MEIDFWAARWKEGRIGFHEGRTNAFLARHVGRLEASGAGGGPGETSASSRVLVPLCGKAEDMAFLASRGHQVVGIEAVEEAAVAFFREHDLAFDMRELDPDVRAYSSGRITLLVADVFACTREHVGVASAFYDRAALVALAPDVRPRYVAHLRTLLAPRAKGLLITFDYDQSKIELPPYAVSEDEVRHHYAGASITAIDEGPLESPKFRAANVQATERCFVVEL